ncbi:unnamed protein product [Meganyctiphanes norvegica]|uniref:Protein DEK n=1 Tax=Meganyctiphanes norvegica TaxID=48144 RepID=A0AAV2Q3T3_MEGNR
MAEEDTKTDINEAKEANEVGESENNERDESKENISDSENTQKNGDEKENEDVEESKENEDEDGDGDGDESKENIAISENTPKKPGVPLYDQPLTQSGKRVRAKAEVFKVEQKKEFEYVFNGSGTALGEIAYIEQTLNKEIQDDLKKLHSVCFGRTGDKLTARKHLKQFNGLTFVKDDEKYIAKLNNMDRFVSTDLKNMCRILGLERSGKKPELIVRVLDFLLKPEDSGKTVVSSKKKRKSKSGSKKRSDTGKKRGPRKSKGGDTENDDTANDDSTANDTADSSDSGSDGSDSSDSEPEEKPKKTPGKKPAKTPAKKTPAKKTPAKKTPAKKTPAKKAATKRSKDEVDSDSDSSDDEPLIKKTKAPPSNDEIKQKVEKILDGADLEEVTMKTVCKQIYEMYPGFDLTDRKSFIKDTVKSIIS